MNDYKNTFKQPLLSNKMDYFHSEVASWDGTDQTALVTFEQFSTSNPNNTYLDIFPDGYSTICFEMSPTGKVRACHYGKMMETKITFYEKKNTYFAVKMPPNLLFEQLVAPPHHYINRVSKLADFTPAFKDFETAVFHELDFEARIAFFQAYVADHFPYVEDPLINSVLEYALQTDGTAKVIDISKQLGVSDRHIRAVFQRKLGVSPKKMLQFMQINLTFNGIMDQKKSVTDVLLTSNFYDHPHFNKVFKGFTTYSPTEFKKLIQ